MIAARAAAHRLAVAVTSCDREHPSRALLRDGEHLMAHLRDGDDPSPAVRTVRCLIGLGGQPVQIQIEDPHLFGVWVALMKRGVDEARRLERLS